MLKICDSVLTEPLGIILKNCIDCGAFIPIHKKNDKHCLNNYCPVSLLPICKKIFERMIFNVFLFLENNNLLLNNLVLDLMIPVSIVHSIYSDLDHNPHIKTNQY